MVANNFQPDFGKLILAGIKQSMMRPQSDRAHAAPGQMVQLFIGSRTKNALRLIEAPCIAQHAVSVQADCIVVDGMHLDRDAADALAQIEGFSRIGNLLDWFDRRYGLPVIGLTQVIWDFSAATFVADWPADWGPRP